MIAIAGSGRTTHALALAGMGISLLGVALTVHPVRASPLIFWVLIGLVAVLVLTIAAIKVPRLRRKKKPQPGLLAPECRRVSDALEKLRTEQWGSLFGNGGTAHLASWRKHTEARYVAELQKWALGVFDDAVACEAISSRSRPLVRSPRADQLEKVRDLFRETAESLDRIAASLP